MGVQVGFKTERTCVDGGSETLPGNPRVREGPSLPRRDDRKMGGDTGRWYWTLSRGVEDPRVRSGRGGVGS